MEMIGIIAGNIIAAMPNVQTERKEKTIEGSADVNVEAIAKMGSEVFPIFIPEVMEVMEFMSKRVMAQATPVRESITPALSRTTLFALLTLGVYDVLAVGLARGVCVLESPFQAIHRFFLNAGVGGEPEPYGPLYVKGE